MSSVGPTFRIGVPTYRRSGDLANLLAIKTLMRSRFGRDDVYPALQPFVGYTSCRSVRDVVADPTGPTNVWSAPELDGAQDQ